MMWKDYEFERSVKRAFWQRLWRAAFMALITTTVSVAAFLILMIILMTALSIFGFTSDLPAVSIFVLFCWVTYDNMKASQ